MLDGDGAEMLELQAYQISQNAIKYPGKAPCPSCGVVMSPVQYMYGLLCPECKEKKAAARVARRMA
jgi:predicted RNA-binding Zn-ribbon protein involved in translation (DUF1610 family)